MEKQEYDSNNIHDKWIPYNQEKPDEEIKPIIKDLNPRYEETVKILDSSIKSGEAREYGSDINHIVINKFSSVGPKYDKKISARLMCFERARNLLNKFIL